VGWFGLVANTTGAVPSTMPLYLPTTRIPALPHLATHSRPTHVYYHTFASFYFVCLPLAFFYAAYSSTFYAVSQDAGTRHWDCGTDVAGWFYVSVSRRTCLLLGISMQTTLELASARVEHKTGASMAYFWFARCGCACCCTMAFIRCSKQRCVGRTRMTALDMAWREHQTLCLNAAPHKT